VEVGAVEVGVGVFGVEFEGLPEVLQGGAMLLECLFAVAAVVVGEEVGGVAPDGFVIVQ
jgi:hypothetical protein